MEHSEMVPRRASGLSGYHALRMLIMPTALLLAFALSGCSSPKSKSEAPSGTGPQETIFSYDFSKSPKGVSTSFRGVQVKIEGTPEASGGDYVSLSAAIAFPNGKLRMAEVGAGLPEGQRDVWIGKLSPSDAAMSVIFSNDSGGNRCCTELSIVSEAYGGDTALNVQIVFGSDLASSLGDYNRDGTKDIVTFDSRFLDGFINSGAGAYHRKRRPGPTLRA